MADNYANIIKLEGGASETAVDLSARMEVGMLAVCPFDGVLVYKNNPSLYTTYPDTDEVIALIGSFGGIDDAPVDGTTYARKDGAWISQAVQDLQDVTDKGSTTSHAMSVATASDNLYLSSTQLQMMKTSDGSNSNISSTQLNSFNNVGGSARLDGNGWMSLAVGSNQLNADATYINVTNGTEISKLNKDGLLIDNGAVSTDHYIQGMKVTDPSGFTDYGRNGIVRSNAGDFDISVNGDIELSTQTGDVLIPDGFLGIGVTPTELIHAKNSGAGLAKVLLENSDTESISGYFMSTPTNPSHGYILTYGSEHPVQPDEVSIKNTVGDITFHTNAENLRIATGGLITAPTMSISDIEAGGDDTLTTKEYVKGLKVRPLTATYTSANLAVGGFQQTLTVSGGTLSTTDKFWANATSTSAQYNVTVNNVIYISSTQVQVFGYALSAVNEDITFDIFATGA